MRLLSTPLAHPVPYVQGIEQKRRSIREALQLPSNAKIYFIAEGGEAKIYRVVEPTDSSYILREHSFSKGDQLSGYVGQAFTQYLSRVQIIAEASATISGMRPNRNLGIYGESQLLKMEDSRGFTVERVLYELRDQPDLARDFVTQYNQVMSELFAAVHAQHPDWVPDVVQNYESGQPVLTFNLQPEEQTDGYLLHTDNVILDLQNRCLIVIDPR